MKDKAKKQERSLPKSKISDVKVPCVLSTRKGRIISGGECGPSSVWTVVENPHDTFYKEEVHPEWSVISRTDLQSQGI